VKIYIREFDQLMAPTEMFGHWFYILELELFFESAGIWLMDGEGIGIDGLVEVGDIEEFKDQLIYMGTL